VFHFRRDEGAAGVTDHVYGPAPWDRLNLYGYGSINSVVAAMTQVGNDVVFNPGPASAGIIVFRDTNLSTVLSANLSTDYVPI